MILEFKPHKVKVRYLPSGKVVLLNRKFFEKHLHLGLYNLVNPEAIPGVRL